MSWEEFKNAFLPPSVDEDTYHRRPLTMTKTPSLLILTDNEIYLKTVFDQCDSNSDGQLSYSEIVNAHFR